MPTTLLLFFFLLLLQLPPDVLGWTGIGGIKKVPLVILLGKAYESGLVDYQKSLKLG